MKAKFNLLVIFSMSKSILTSTAHTPDTVDGSSSPKLTYSELIIIYLLANIVILSSIYLIDQKITSFKGIFSMKTIAIITFMTLLINMTFVTYVYMGLVA